ncbi:OCIA domain-containing protein 1 isoform X2 [Callorhinchus milii]|nr:OCIA domain-containing protein 1 isoform X2 [Callorhinchus milii]|eukprot:gi/632950775/ref/XP_007890921.1/ PREDICTED: OCIA domain-containing protein 1 isoform X2 [Callorhinchus milii]
MSGSYIPTEDEKRVFRECNEESFYYRSLPFSGMSMLLAQVLISRGILSSSPRFGSLPKVVFAGACGYLAGKISYMKICQAKFMKLENSPLAEAIRTGRRIHPSHFSNVKSGFTDSPVKQPAISSSQFDRPSSYSDDYSYADRSLSNYNEVPFSSSLSESAPTGADSTLEEPNEVSEEFQPEKKHMTYEELRNKNREMYEVTLTQKAESFNKPSARAPKTEVKTNQYGDAWED